ncbi:hypothetical protein OVY01_13650 [Robbsia sp. Bb-Pol-6]|uniref:Uncharacterized protein n=1 Tax=Robbsia betulipollinis TaxID=2981849 RepID=A0ABT3ZPR1_9BURK|nr:hypothetical protein [Robbsia betulipollinis]MCY0388262.1 hypothetical protein [Robbsia betulipollinis]
MQIPSAITTALQFAFHTVAAKVMALSSEVNHFVSRITQGRVNQAVFAEKAAHYAVKLDAECPYLAKKLGMRPSAIISAVCSGNRSDILNTAQNLLHAGVRELIGERPGDRNCILAGLFARDEAPRA